MVLPKQMTLFLPNYWQNQDTNRQLFNHLGGSLLNIIELNCKCIFFQLALFMCKDLRQAEVIMKNIMFAECHQTHLLNIINPISASSLLASL